MLRSLRGPSRAPSLDYLDLGSNLELPGHEAAQRVANGTLKKGQAPFVRDATAIRRPGTHNQPVINTSVHNLLEDLLVRGLSVTVGLQSGSPEGPAFGLQPEGVVLYLPLVRECKGPPKLHVRVNNSKGPGCKPLQVCLSSSTVSFCTESGAPSGVAVPEENVRHSKLGEALPAGYSSSAVASTANQTTETAAPGPCIVQLISSCGSLLCFKADPAAPLENQLAHDVLCIFRAFDFDTIRLYGCLCAAVKEASAQSQFEDVLNALPLFALKRGCPAAGESGAFKGASTAPSTTTTTRGATLAKTAVGGSATAGRAHEDSCWPLPSLGSADTALPWAKALACNWILHIANHEDGVRERHALICAFRRFVFSAREKGHGIASGIVSGIECPSEGSSLGLDTTVPSEATIAAASVCGEAPERCVKPRQDVLNITLGPDATIHTDPNGQNLSASSLGIAQPLCRRASKTKALNPHAAPFVPRVPFSALGTTWGHTFLKSTLSADGHADGPAAAAAIATLREPVVVPGPSTPAEAAAEDSATPLQPLDEFKGHPGGDQGIPQEQLSGGLMCAGKLQRCKKSSSATTHRASTVEVLGNSWYAVPATREQGNRKEQHSHQPNKQHQQQQWASRSRPWRPRSHSAPSRSVKTAATVEHTFSKKCQYTLSAMLGLRKQSLQLQHGYNALNFVLQQQQPQCSSDEPPVPSYSLNSTPCAPGDAVSPLFAYPAMGRGVSPCLTTSLNHGIFRSPPPPHLPRRHEGPLQHPRGPQQQTRRGQSSSSLGGSWDGFANGGPLLPLPKVAPSGPPLLPTPSVPPIAAIPFQQHDHGALLTGYWGTSERGTTGTVTHSGVPLIPGSPTALVGPPVRPLLCSPMQHDGSRVRQKTMLLQESGLLQQQLQNQLQHRLLFQGVPSAAFPQKPSHLNPEHLRRVTRASKSPRKIFGCPQHRRHRQSNQQQQPQPLHNPSVCKPTPDQRSNSLTECPLPLSNELALQKLLGMVTSLLMSRSGCKELQQQQQQ